MIENLKPYPEYKDSGLPWLGQVPAHWEIRRGKSLFSESNLPVRDGDEIVTCFRDGQVTLRKNRRTSGFMTALYEAGYQGVRTGQLVIHAMDAFAGAIGISDSDGKCTPEYIVLDPLSNSAHPSYFSQLLRHAARQQFILVQCPAVRERAPRFRYPNFGCMWMPLPPANEQAAIARLLTWATNRLDRAIGAKRHIITLLQEQKQAIIHRAVTRGLDPSVPLKDSGIPWLGEIPEHWEARRLKDVATVQTGITLGKDYGLVSTTVYRYLRVANVQSDRLDLRNVKHVAVPEVEAKRSTLMPGDVLMTEGGDIDKLGRGCLWSGEVASCLHQNHVFAVRCGAGLIPGFLVALMGSAHGRSYFQITAKQTTNLASTNSTTLKAFPLLLPEHQEQQQILSFIDGETGHLFMAITDTEREITLLREYRTRLIADVVTGKLDVREVAKGLPEVELQVQPDVAAGYDAEEAEDDAVSDLIDTTED
jgi:type I restriction enzyme S subunit